MASNSAIQNNPPDTESRSPKKRRKIDIENSLQSTQTTNDHTRWRTASEQQIYSSKLVEALRRRAASGGGGVRDTADRVLAVAAKGKTRWSRAILTSRVRMQMSSVNRKHRRAKGAKVVRGGNNKNQVPQMKKKVPVLQQKVQVLGRLVPGCKKVSFPNLLEETTDYIEALEMQVRAMTFLTQLLSGTGGGLTGPPVHAPGSGSGPGPVQPET